MILLLYFLLAEQPAAMFFSLPQGLDNWLVKKLKIKNIIFNNIIINI